MAFDWGQSGQVELFQVQLAGTMDTAVMLSLFESDYAASRAVDGDLVYFLHDILYSVEG